MGADFSYTQLAGTSASVTGSVSVSGTAAVTGSVDVLTSPATPDWITGSTDSRVQGMIRDGLTSSYNPVQVGGVYYNDPSGSALTTTGSVVTNLRVDQYRDLMVSLATAIAGENVLSDILEVGEVGLYKPITGSGMTTVCTGSGVLLKAHYLNIATGSSNVTFYDALSYTPTAAVMVPRHNVTTAEVPGNAPWTVAYGMKFNYGLLCDVTGSTNLTLTYKVST